MSQTPPNPLPCAAIVLCGGHSSRMGFPKALLPFGAESMVGRVVRILAEAATPVVVVAAEDQSLPAFPAGVRVVRDRQPNRGPLEGLAAGLAALADTSCQAAYLSGCDVPLLQAAFVRRMIERLGNHQIAVPCAGGQLHPLSAVYRLTVQPHVQRLLQEDRRGPVHLFNLCDTRQVSAEELAEVDPQLQSLVNVNRPEAYFATLRCCGFDAPDEIAQALAPRNDNRRP